MAELGLGMGSGETHFDGATNDFSGPAGYINAGFGRTLFFNVGTSINLRLAGSSKDDNDYSDLQYHDITVAWVGGGLNLGRMILNVDFAFGGAGRHNYQAAAQTGTDYTKDKIEDMMGYRVAVIVVPFMWGKKNSITLTSQYIDLSADEFTRSTYVNDVLTTTTKIKSSSTAKSTSAFLAYMRTF